MTLTQLEYIVALDNYRHFVTAAEKCFVTQPSLSAQVKKLEQELGLLIFNRTKTPLEPTKEGMEIVQKARSVLREVVQLREFSTNQRISLVGEFRVGIIPTLAPYLLPLFLGRFVKEHPNTRLVIEEKQSLDIIRDLKNDLLDLGILVTPVNNEAIREFPVFNEPFLGYLPANDPLIRKSKLKHKDAMRNDLWILNQGHCFRNQVIKICNPELAQRKFQNLQYESGSIEALKKLVDQNMGFTLIPELSVLNEVSVNPKIKRFEAPEPIREVSIITHVSFPKQILIETLRSMILESIPEHMRLSKEDPMALRTWRLEGGLYTYIQ